MRREETNEVRAAIEFSRQKTQRQTEETMDGWSATRSREVRSNRVGGKDTGS